MTAAVIDRNPAAVDVTGDCAADSETTWETPLSMEDKASHRLALECAYGVEAVCVLLMRTVDANFITDDSEWKALIRMASTRIKKLNGTLMSHLDEDGMTVGQAYRAVHGVHPPFEDRP